MQQSTGSFLPYMILGSVNWPSAGRGVSSDVDLYCWFWVRSTGGEEPGLMSEGSAEGVSWGGECEEPGWEHEGPGPTGDVSGKEGPDWECKGPGLRSDGSRGGEEGRGWEHEGPASGPEGLRFQKNRFLYSG